MLRLQSDAVSRPTENLPFQEQGTRYALHGPEDPKHTLRPPPTAIPSIPLGSPTKELNPYKPLSNIQNTNHNLSLPRVDNRDLKKKSSWLPVPASSEELQGNLEDHYSTLSSGDYLQHRMFRAPNSPQLPFLPKSQTHAKLQKQTHDDTNFRVCYGCQKKMFFVRDIDSQSLCYSCASTVKEVCKVHRQNFETCQSNGISHLCDIYSVQRSYVHNV